MSVAAYRQLLPRGAPASSNVLWEASTVQMAWPCHLGAFESIDHIGEKKKQVAGFSQVLHADEDSWMLHFPLFIVTSYWRLYLSAAASCHFRQSLLLQYTPEHVIPASRYFGDSCTNQAAAVDNLVACCATAQGTHMWCEAADEVHTKRTSVVTNRSEHLQVFI